MSRRHAMEAHHRQRMPGGDHADESPRARSTSSSTPRPSWINRRVLLLNASFEPLTTVAARRAIILVLRGRAEILHPDASGILIHAASGTIPVPSVIRLTTYVRVPYIARVPLTRATLMQRDRNRCGYCGGRADTIDHVIPRSRGGTHTWENCVACCTRCNHRKADKLLSEIGWTLAAPLRAPAGRHWHLVSKIRTHDPVWSDYVPALASA
ncbi:HNH endonuclease [Lolliginicoccus levis]|uniref:HNH endonuclease n=1 Tax=Lolliginicoccus levis TaxID=2919542 RepID=UPI00241EC39B|nr:HNH endonuclease [Lolliginicoccus levis]